MSNYLILILLSFFMLISIAAGTQFKVGGSNGWSVPDTNAMSYSQWAAKNRFKIGDSLLFVYLPDEDSVLLVNADAYNSCNTSSFVDFFNDGNTVFTFTRSSHFYFISGKKDYCHKNEKLVVVVMADRSNRSSLAPAPLPASASPPPPPYGGEVEEPTAQPSPNGASSRVIGMVSTIGAVLGALPYVF
ncbi:early nodulin-like protein [Musa troglodytarum]|uniref:Early nodulin-like protein n=1 Tax=Musa troglodytarum TaxID=320322 RepID=A0A9E7HGT2_9LILI|nr:early nodulin-like protein [Musa troglodytarum]